MLLSISPLPDSSRHCSSPLARNAAIPIINEERAVAGQSPEQLYPSNMPTTNLFLTEPHAFVTWHDLSHDVDG
jgi:hypothetical protein